MLSLLLLALSVTAVTSLSFQAKNHWNGGFQVDIALPVPTDMNGWILHLTFSQDLQSVDEWVGVLTKINAREYTIKNNDWDAKELAGTTLTFNLMGHGTGDIAPSVDVVFEGVAGVTDAPLTNAPVTEEPTTPEPTTPELTTPRPNHPTTHRPTVAPGTTHTVRTVRTVRTTHTTRSAGGHTSTPPPLVVASGEDLFLHGSFEDIESEFHWSCACVCITISTNAHTGMHSMQVQNRNAESDGPYQAVHLEAGKSYQASVYLKIIHEAATPGATFRVDADLTFTDGTNSLIKVVEKEVKLADGWVLIQGNFAVPGDKSLKQSLVHFHGPIAEVNFVIDDAKLVAAPAGSIVGRSVS